MKVLFRNHKGTLSEAMAGLKQFDSIKEMLEWLVQEHRGAFKLEELYISYYCYDSRIDWETFIVTTSRYGNEDYIKLYNHPQAIGFCTVKGANDERICTCH